MIITIKNNLNLQISKYLRQLYYWRILNKNAEKYTKYKSCKLYQKTLAHPKNLADTKTLAHPKCLADAKNLAHPKSLADANLGASKILAPTEMLTQQEK
jgi:hypothetical protein